jgi:AraC-like DNA-binding protein
MTETPLQGQVPAPYVRLLFDWLEQRGVDAPRLLGEPAPVASERGLARVPVAHWKQLLERAAAHLRDPLLGLRLGQTITPAHLGALGYVLLACGSLGAALQRLERYQRLIYDVNALRQQIDGGSLVLSWGVEHGRPGPLVDECAIAALVQFARNITGTAFAPEAIGFVNPAPADLAPYRAFFGTPPRFGEAETSVRLALTSLQLPLRQPDAALLAILEAQAETQLMQLPGSDAFEQIVRRQIASLAREGEPCLERVAESLHLSPRTLRRRLQERNRQFRDLHDETLCRIAEGHLRDPRLQLAEVALLLGYSEQSAFTRAFRRWTGTTPAAFRRGSRSIQSLNTP